MPRSVPTVSGEDPTRFRRTACRAAVAVRALALVACTATAADALDVDRLMRNFGLSLDAAARVRNGDIVSSDAAPSSSRELAVGLTFLVPRPIADVWSELRSAIDMSADPLLQAASSIRGSPADFRTVALPADEARRYLAAAPGDTLNLSNDEIDAFRTVGASGGDTTGNTEAVLRRVLRDRYRAYHARGLDGMAPYTRAAGDVRQPADELRRAADATALLASYDAPLWQLLHAYPAGKPHGVDESFYVLTYELDGRPNYVLRQRLAVPFDNGVAVVDRDFYVSHGYNTSQAVTTLFAVPGGTMVFYQDRVSTDQITGVGSSVRRTIGRRVMAERLTAIFERTRACFEGERMCPLTDAARSSQSPG